MKKKLILAAVGLVSVFTLASCSAGSQKIATMKGGSITVQDFYDQVKGTSSSQNTVKQMIVYKVFEQSYGKDVSDKDVQAKYDELKETVTAQGYDFDSQLKQYGYTEKTYKEQIKQSLAYKAGLEAHVELTDEDLETAWATFHPEVEAQIIKVATEDEANEIKTELDNGGDFTEIAKEKSTDTATKADGGTIKFDSQSTNVPATVSSAAFALADGEVSAPIAATDSYYQTTYYLVKMVKNQDKGNDMTPYKSELEEIAKTTKLSDQTFVNKVISDVLTEANVKIKDDSFSDILSDLIQTTDSSSSSSSSSAAATSSSSSKTEDSSTTESSTADSSATESSN